MICESFWCVNLASLNVISQNSFSDLFPFRVGYEGHCLMKIEAQMGGTVHFVVFFQLYSPSYSIKCKTNKLLGKHRSWRVSPVFYSFLFCFVLFPHISENIQDLSLSVWLTSLSIKPSRSTHVITDDNILFFFMAGHRPLYMCLCMCVCVSHISTSILFWAFKFSFSNKVSII